MNSIELVNHLHQHPFVLAPMAGVTDLPFRTFMRQMRAGVVVTELVSAHGILHRGQKTFDLMRFEEVQRPIGIQLFGESAESIAQAAFIAQELNPDFIDLNFGCPVKKVVSKGAGAATLRDLKHLAILLATVKKAIQIPLTIKIRTGWDEQSRNALEVVNIAYNEGVTWVAIHGRTRAAGYSGLADWDFIGDVKHKTKIPIIGNGDVLTAVSAIELKNKYGVDGVMIGRGCLKNPWIFAECENRANNHATSLPRDYVQAFTNLYDLWKKTYEERYLLIQMRKFASWFSAGLPNASQFRKTIFQVSSANELLFVIQDYFSATSITADDDKLIQSLLQAGEG